MKYSLNCGQQQTAARKRIDHLEKTHNTTITIIEKSINYLVIKSEVGWDIMREWFSDICIVAIRE